MKSTILRLFFFASLILFLGAPPARGQSGFTSVSATVKDASGNLYAGCRGGANFVASPTGTTQSLLSGSVFQTSVSIAACDSFGNFTIVLADTALVTPAGSTWQFSICSQDGKTCFSYTAPTSGAGQITGSSINITTALQAAAAPLFGGLPTLGGNNPWTGLNSYNKQITSSVPTGTAPFLIASTTVVPNLNASLLGGQSAPASVTIANLTAFNDSGALSVAMTAGHKFSFNVTTGSSGCTAGPNTETMTAVFQ